MEKYKVRIKSRMIFEMIGTFVFLPMGIYALVRYLNMEGAMSGTPFKEFIGGMFNGLRAGIIIGFVIYLIIIFIKNMLVLKNEEKLRKMYYEEYDERALAIREHSSRVTYNITMYIILGICAITGLYNTTISLTLLAVWIFILLTRTITMYIYNNIM